MSDETRNDYITLEQVVDSWARDSVIDKSELGDAQLQIESLYDKYLKVLAGAKRQLRRAEAEYKRVRLDRFEYWTMGPTKAQLARGVRPPPQGRVLKKDAEPYVDADPEVLAMAERVAEAREVVDAITEKLSLIKSRGYRIKDAIRWILFTQGAPNP